MFHLLWWCQTIVVSAILGVATVFLWWKLTGRAQSPPNPKEEKYDSEPEQDEIQNTLKSGHFGKKIATVHACTRDSTAVKEPEARPTEPLRPIDFSKFAGGCPFSAMCASAPGGDTNDSANPNDLTACSADILARVTQKMLERKTMTEAEKKAQDEIFINTTGVDGPPPKTGDEDHSRQGRQVSFADEKDPMNVLKDEEFDDEPVTEFPATDLISKLGPLHGKLATAELRAKAARLERGLTEQQRLEEAEIRRQQLESIFKLMQKQEEKFGVHNREELAEQMRMYAL